MKVLGLDISTKTGCVVVDFSNPTRPSTPHDTEINFQKLSGLERCSSIAGAILEVVDEHKPSVAVIEGYGYANSNTLVTLVEIGTVVRYFLRQIGMPYIVVAPNSLKKFVTGKGTASKELIILHVFQRWGYSATTNNIADAYGLAMMGGALYGKVTMPKAHSDALVSIRRAGIPALSCT